MAPLLFLFLDGVGLGAEDEGNPLALAATPFLRELLGGPLTRERGERADTVVLRRIDATLATPGLPQSATGQATLLTGENAARLMGRHYGPWPGPTIARLLERGNLFIDATARGAPLLANAYPPAYLEALRSRRRRPNAPLLAALGAGLEPLGLEAYRSGAAISADLSGEHFAALGDGLPRYQPRAAGRLLARLAAGHSLTFFDFWPSDLCGHAADLKRSVALVERLDAFLQGVAEELGEVTLLVTSDHGNLEEGRHGAHTRSPVPLLALGPGALEFAAASELSDVAPAARRVLRLG